MSNKEGEMNPLVPSGRARRRFLKSIAFAAASTSTATMLPTVGRGMQEAVVETPGKCPDVAIPMREVEGKVAFITGGSSGIGLGIARAFADAGMKIVIGYRTKGHLDEAMQYLKSAHDRVYAIKVDVTDRPGTEQAAAETIKIFGKVHVLVNNAGVTVPASLSRTSYEDWDWLMGVNLHGVFNGVHTFLPHIKAHGEGGQIITTSSILGLFVAGGGQGAYCVSKFAVVGMMEALRAELTDTNVGVSVFCPGVVQSNLFDSNRNRPIGPADRASKADSNMSALKKAMKDSPVAMDPLEAGQHVLRGMRNNDLYIFSHPEFEQVIQLRNEALIASVPANLHPTETRLAMARSVLQNSIYTTERDRKLCARRRVPR